MTEEDPDAQTFLVRMATRNDVADILRLYRDLNPDDTEISMNDAMNQFDALSRIPASGIHVGLIKQEMVSTCTLIVVPNLTRGGQPYALIENVVTVGHHRGHGYGRRTLQNAVSSAWDAGCYKVMLLTGSTRPETLGFYRSAGFEQNKTGFQIRRIAPRAN